ncbi:MAG: glycosyl hydrolase 2 galactose-binding domain-containing protein [Bacteroidota bacterium]
MSTFPLDGTWQRSYGPQGSDPDAFASIEAQVPGNVELDLMRAGVLPELSHANNIYLLREYEGFQWWYRRSFAAPAVAEGERVELVFEGLDCIGTVWVNDRLVGQPRNMLIPHRFDVTDLLRPDGGNELVVRIDSAVLEGRKHEPAAIEGAMASNWESLSVRKAAHMYGWDIMPRVVSAGLWRSVYLEILPATRFGDVYLATASANVEKRRAEVFADWHVITDRFAIDDWQVELTLRLGGQVAHQSTHALLGTHGRVRLSIDDARLWWPRGYGEQPLYDAQIRLLDGDGKILATHNQRIGLRTIRLVRRDITPDAPGEFVFMVNGEKIFAKGTNWVPLDALHSRDPQHLLGAMEMICDLNCNMIRCWGGNVYEDHAFYSLCDENGIMVWQDFALACALYPQTDGFCAVIGNEARTIVRRLRQHPSIALWAGNNENDGFYYGGWLAAPVDPNTDRLSREVLREVVRQHDPFRDYLPSSPYMSPEVIATGEPNKYMPEQHLWGPRDDFKGPYYTGSNCSFVSEIGYHGCPNRESLEKMMDPEHLWPWQDNEQWLTHAVRPLPQMTNYNYRIPLMGEQIEVLFSEIPDNLDDYILASQISQAEAKKFFVERFRSGKWQRTGILWWNLRDGWPIISDAIVDYYGSRKLAYEYLKRVQADVCAICDEAADGRHTVHVVNDTLKQAAGHLTVRDLDSGTVLFDSDYTVATNDRLEVGSIPAATQAAMWVLEWTANGQAFRNHYLAGPRPFKLDHFRHWLASLELAP